MSLERNLPWVEKYRPKTLDEIISHKDIISTLKIFLENRKLPHLLFHGPPGSGKTTAVQACAHYLYTPKEYNSMVLELNASDDRGIGVVREQILNFASTRTIFNKGFKLIILDEADAMTNDAQNALRRIIEKFTTNTRFCLICNYLSGIIPALQSRCTKFRFGPLSNDQMILRLKNIAEAENVLVTDDGYESLACLSAGDMRKAICVMQSTHLAFNEVCEKSVYDCVGHPSKRDVRSILLWVMNEDLLVAFNKVISLKKEKAYALVDILSEVTRYIHRINFDSDLKIHILEHLADVEYRLAQGASEIIQTGSFVAAFQAVRQID